MAVRIRYAKHGDKELLTKQTYLLPTGQLVGGHILFLETGFSAEVSEVDKQVPPLVQQTVDTLKDAKKAVKTLLSLVGVVFNTELRAKKSNEPETSETAELTDPEDL